MAGFAPQQVDCVILDDGGFLLMSNQDEYITQVDIYSQCHFNARFSNIVCFIFNLFNIFTLFQIGQFFGEVDPVLMISLVNTSLFSFNKTYDYQSVCDPERETKAAAGPRSVYVVKYTCQL